MYSIIIVLVAAALVFLAIKKTEKNHDTSVGSSGAVVSQEESPASAPTPTVVADIPADQLMMTTVKEGTGPEAQSGDTLAVHYTGYLADGTKFDSSFDRGAPFEFTIGEGKVIKGWEIGITGMKKGEIRKLIIPPQYGYGEAGFPGVIPGNATLAFEVELIEIKAK